MNHKTMLALAAVVIGTLVLTFLQHLKIVRLQRDVSALHSKLTAVTYDPGLGAPGAGMEASIENLEDRLHLRANATSEPPTIEASTENLDDRLRRLEVASAEFSGVTEELRKQGNLPLHAKTIAGLKVQLQNPTATDEERFRALRLLRRTQNLPDSAFYDVLTWLQTSTNAHTRRTLVSRLKDFPHADYRQPLLELLNKEDSLAVRYQIIASLHPFRGDSQVEDRLWQLSQNDPDRGLRELALRELAKGQLTSERIAVLQANTMRADLPLEDQLLAFRTLRNAQAISPPVLDRSIDLAGLAEDPSRRARMLSALDGVTDGRIKAPLVQGLQDPSPVVRERAAHVLGRFANSDDRIRDWLIYITENDPAPEVQREANRMLER